MQLKHQLEKTARTWAEIDLSALEHNLRLAQRTGKPVMCVIKANAYGHGAVECGKQLEKSGAAAFAVASLGEAVELREGGIALPILVLGHTDASYAPILIKHALMQTVVSVEAATALNEAAKQCSAKAMVHIKLDTGMSRAGIMAQGEFAHKALEAAEQICMMKNLCVEGMYTHFSVADDEAQNEYTAWQLENFHYVVRGLTEKNLRPKVCHAANSAAIISHNAAHFDMVREGIMLYGLYPNSQPNESGELRPVMTLKTRISQVKQYPNGASVSYGRTFCKAEPLKTAVLVAGYADGLNRRLSGRFSVSINGKKYPQIGRICMDMCMAEIGEQANIAAGDEATLIGCGSISWEQAANIVGTINYELTCLVTARSKRVYIHGAIPINE